MLNYLWAFMILAGTIYGGITGNIDKITDGFLTGGEEAINLSMALFGVVAFWSGLMKIALNSGLVESIQKKISPIVSFLFKSVPKNHPARKYISLNLVSNFLGLGVAATPAGLKAMEELAKLQDEQKGYHEEKMSDEMCTFIVVNISSIQLIPITVIAYRASYQSSSPASIILPGIIATTISTLAGIIFCKIKCKSKQFKYSKYGK